MFQIKISFIKKKSEPNVLLLCNISWLELIPNGVCIKERDCNQGRWNEFLILGIGSNLDGSHWLDLK